MSHNIRFATCMAEETSATGRNVAGWLAGRLGTAAEFVEDVPWQERERLLYDGRIHVCWLCGLPYVLKAEEEPGSLDLLAAPVFRGDRYQNEPIYFSDVVVRVDNPCDKFDDLRGKTWAYNEPRSHSGHGVVLYQLALAGETRGFFGRAVESGSHRESLRMVLSGEADAAALDSVVLEAELRSDPALAKKVRVVETWGPSPSPPWVASQALPAPLRRSLREAMVGMSEDPEGRRILLATNVARFAAVEDRDYRIIRRMARRAGAAVLVKAGPSLARKGEE